MAGDQMVIGGRYELDDLLGRGGMAEVRRAVDTRLGRPVAVKQLRTDLATDPTFQARFRREAQSAAGLNHPNIVAVYDTGEETDPRTGHVDPVHRDGAGRGADAARRAPGRPQDPAGAGARAHPGRPGRPQLQPPGRDHPPRHQAGQRDADPGRHGQGDGLRHRPGRRRHQRDDDPDRGGDRDRPVPVAGAGARRDRGRPQRHLLRRLPDVRAAGRPAAVRRRVAGQRGLPARTRGAGAAEPARPGDHPRHRRGDAEGAGQGPGRPLPVGPGDEGRHHPGAGRAAGDRGRAAGATPPRPPRRCR